MVVTKIHRHLNTSSDTVMRRRLLRLLVAYTWNMSAVASELGVSRFTLYKVVSEDNKLRSAHARAKRN